MGFRLRAVSLHADSDRTISRVAEHLAVAWASVENGVPDERLLDRTNINGGAIAIGHPLGASGARIMTTLVNALEQRGGSYGLQTMCEGGGMANATIIERLG
jgi:acetyl-CoA acyltransferase